MSWRGFVRRWLSMSLSIDEQLRQSRLNLQREVRLALSCKDNNEKLLLVQRWKREYPPLYVKELIAVARNKRVAADILAWDLDKL